LGAYFDQVLEEEEEFQRLEELNLKKYYMEKDEMNV
jgi:hypothetical protein